MLAATATICFNVHAFIAMQNLNPAIRIQLD
jgi:hypothetical protein